MVRVYEIPTRRLLEYLQIAEDSHKLFAKRKEKESQHENGIVSRETLT